jgi:hypothetical protein
VIDEANTLYYNNSIGIYSSLLESSSLYTVMMNVTDGTSTGYNYQTYRSNPEISFEFRVFPTSGQSVDTTFSFIITEQFPFSTLNRYSYGYVDESGNLIPLF